MGEGISVGEIGLILRKQVLQTIWNQLINYNYFDLKKNLKGFVRLCKT